MNLAEALKARDNGHMVEAILRPGILGSWFSSKPAWLHGPNKEVLIMSHYLEWHPFDTTCEIWFLENFEFRIAPKKNKKQQVWQWRYRSQNNDSVWATTTWLLTEAGAEAHFNKETLYEKHAGPFEVEV